MIATEHSLLGVVDALISVSVVELLLPSAACSSLPSAGCRIQPMRRILPLGPHVLFRLALDPRPVWLNIWQWCSARWQSSTC